MIKRKTKRRSSELAELDRASREIENRIQELEASLKRPAQQTRMRLDRNTMPPPDRVREGTQNRALRAVVAAPNETQPLYMLGIIQHSQNRNAEAAASLEKVVAAREDPSVRYSLGILYAYYLEQPDKGLEQLQKALDNPNTPADLKKAVAEEVTKIKEHKNHTPQQAQ